MKKQTNMRYKIVLYKGDWIFQVIMKKTRKAAELAEKEYRKEVKEWDESESRPNASTRGWVITNN